MDGSSFFLTCERACPKLRLLSSGGEPRPYNDQSKPESSIKHVLSLAGEIRETYLELSGLSLFDLLRCDVNFKDRSRAGRRFSSLDARACARDQGGRAAKD
jgi:hypothetical protein